MMLKISKSQGGLGEASHLLVPWWFPCQDLQGHDEVTLYISHHTCQYVSHKMRVFSNLAFT